MPTNPELEARLLANPDDNDTWAVYGDWLSQQGDPRGELAALQRKGGLEAAEAAIIKTNPAWLGELGTLGELDFGVTWKHGFIHSVRIGPIDSYDTSEIDFGDTIRKVFALPGIQFLHELVIGSKAGDDWPCEWDDCVEALAECEIASLRKLVFDHGGYWDISSTSLGSLESIYPKLPNLRELVISMGQWSVAGIDLPELRSLEIISGGTFKKDLEHIRTGNLPKLASLSLCLGQTGGDYGGDIEIDDLRWIFAAEGLPNVRHLGLANYSQIDGVIEPLAGSNILRQLRSLDLSRGTLGQEGLQVMLDHADAFRHLETIDVSKSYLRGSEALAKLLTLGPTIVADDLNGTADPDDRFVSVSE